jgi:hypothetical protein
MGEEFYCLLKLISGEEVLSLVLVDDNDGDPLIILQNPVSIKIIDNGPKTLIKIKNWIEVCDDDMYIIKLDKVITMTEIKDQKLIDVYNDYLSDEHINYYSPGGKVGISSDMGYLSSVEEARKKLENLFKGNKES